jgi:hypothetical protein
MEKSERSLPLLPTRTIQQPRFPVAVAPPIGVRCALCTPRRRHSGYYSGIVTQETVLVYAWPTYLPMYL